MLGLQTDMHCISLCVGSGDLALRLEVVSTLSTELSPQLWDHWLFMRRAPCSVEDAVIKSRVTHVRTVDTDESEAGLRLFVA